MNEKIEYLKMLQLVITRMGDNSFKLKGWSVTLTSALFALAAKNADSRYVVVSYFPIVMFWALDGYFLYQERLFRKLYDKARAGQDASRDFSMNTSEFKNDADVSWSSVTLSSTVFIFHGVVLFTVCIVLIFLKA